MNTIQNLFQQAQLAEAAYANLAGMNAATPKTTLELALKTGDGKFSAAQAAAFVNEWSVVSQQPDTESGFSATLFKNKSGAYSLAIRGSTPVQGFRDFIFDAKLISTDGIAVSQVVDLYNYWQSLTHLGVYQAASLNTQLAATAFLGTLYAGVAAGVPAALLSLFGGVTIITSYEVARAVLINNGYIVEGGKVYTAEFDLSTNVYTDSRQWGSNILAGQSVNVDGHSLGGHLAMAFSRLFPSATNSVTAVNGLGFKVADANVNNLFTALRGAPGFDASKIQNVYGMEGYEFAAMNNGVLQQPGAWDGIYIESASLPASVALGHSATQMTDSLAVYSLFATLDPALNTAATGIQTITAILKAESNVAADSLESAMTALGKLFNVPSAVVTGDAFDTNRDLLYKAIAGFNSIVNAPFAVVPTIQSLTSITATTLAANARTGIAYRYALLQLNPFVASGMDYSGFNQHGELDLYNATTHTGDFTDQYLQDRAAMLAVLIERNTADSKNASSDILYSDAARNITLRSGSHYTEAMFQQIRFGDSGNNSLTGGSLVDHLYGGGGNDVLKGMGGNDYIEGGAGDDTYIINIGDGIDTIEDKQGTNNKVVINGKPLYFFYTQADGTYLSPDAAFKAEMSGTDLLVTERATGIQVILNKDFQSGDFGITFRDIPTDPTTTKTLTGDIIPTDINSGTAGIQAQRDAQGNLIGAAGLYEDILVGTAADEHILSGALNDDIGGRAGNDWIEGGSGSDYINGDEGLDLIEGGAGADILAGDAGDDRIFGNTNIETAIAITNGNADTPTGLKGDWLAGNAGDDTLVAGAGNDVLTGGAGRDLIIAGAGDDYIAGDADYTPQAITEATPRYSVGSINWYHTSSVPFNWTVTPQAGIYLFQPADGLTEPPDSGADVIYAGAGADHVWAGAGSDIAFGEGGNDTINGEAGDDVLMGGAGDDAISGDASYVNASLHGDDYIDGGDGNDSVGGNGGNDILFGGAECAVLFFRERCLAAANDMEERMAA